MVSYVRSRRSCGRHWQLTGASSIEMIYIQVQSRVVLIRHHATLPMVLLLHLPLLVQRQRDTGKETRYTFFLLYPVAHELREIFGTALGLCDELHLHAALSSTRRLEDKGGIEVELRRHAHLPVWVERELDAEDGRDGLLELIGLCGEDLQR